MTVFRPTAIKVWSSATLLECKDMLTQRGICVHHASAKPSTKAIIDVQYRYQHMPIRKDDETPQRHHEKGSVTCSDVAEHNAKLTDDRTRTN